MCTLDMYRLLLNQRLIEAAKNGNLPFVMNLFSIGADLHAEEDYALGIASQNGHLDVVEYLISHGADIHAENDYAIRVAPASGNTSVFNLLLSMYKPQKNDSAFTAMIIINNHRLTKKYYKHLSKIFNYNPEHKLETGKQIARYIIRNTAINNQWLADAIYATNYRIHKTKVSNPTNKLRKQYKN